MENKIPTDKEIIEVKINEELGTVSALFMSQGNIKAKDIVMPSEELSKSADRIMSLVNQAQIQILEEVAGELEKSKWLLTNMYGSHRHTPTTYDHQAFAVNGVIDKTLNKIEELKKK